MCNQVTEWRRQLLERAVEVFASGGAGAAAAVAPDLKELHAKIGQQALEIDLFFSRRARRRHVGTLMRRVGIEALYRKPNTSKKHPAHPVFWPSTPCWAT